MAWDQTEPSTAVACRSASAWSRGGPVSVRRSSGGMTSHGQRRARRGGLGAGIVDVPPVPPRDPLEALLCAADLPTDERRPSLEPGELVGGQYEVRGCLGRGGLGWVYLAWDRKVEHWVVLKGLLDAEDEDAQRVAVAERRFLAAVEHPNIVRIYNFVEHADRRTGADVGYIVMEYVGGRSLRQLHDVRGPLPLGDVLSYGLEALQALAYLHGRGLLYCDLKPDNVMQVENQLRLIDLGGVCRMNPEDEHTEDGYIDIDHTWGTAGYQAPEIFDSGPSVASDLYTLGRMLARLTFRFPGFSTHRAYTLPDPGEVALLARHDSYHRLLLRATNPDPGLRFASAEAMAEQLYGVLREAAARDEDRPRPAPSTLFGPELRVAGSAGGRLADHSATALALPAPLVDADDPHAGLLATLGATGPGLALRALSELASPSVETQLLAARAWIELDQPERAGKVFDDVEEETERGDWRVRWYRGVEALAAERVDDAVEIFEAIYDAFPGEAAPKLALGLCAERHGQHEHAAFYYELVWCTDHTYVSAAFGLARAHQALGDRTAAAATLESVPATSRYAVMAHLAGVLLRVRAYAEAALEAEPLDSEFFEAADRLETLELDDRRRLQAEAEVLEVALAWLLAGRPGTQDQVPRTVMGHQLTEKGLRLGLERTYRKLAKLADETEDRVRLVDQANAVRPRTWR